MPGPHGRNGPELELSQEAMLRSPSEPAVIPLSLPRGDYVTSLIRSLNSGGLQPSLWGSCGEGWLPLSPAQALAGAVANEEQQMAHLVAIQILDGVVQALLGILVRLMGKRIVNMGWPTLFLQGSQDHLLIRCAQPITLHQLIVPAQL